MKEKSTKRVFVSGGAGVIGRELVSKLEDFGTEILVGDLKPRPNTFGTSVRYIQGDLTNLNLAELQSFSPNAFIHLAATFERSTETIGFWSDNFHNNIFLSHHLMTLARQCPELTRVIFASSYLIYDPSLYQFDSDQSTAFELNEAHPISPRNLTGMSKLAHEVELGFLAGFENYPFSSVCARIFRGYGLNSRDVISRWVRDLIAGKSISVYRPEGLFDYIYCKDTAEGLLRLMYAEHVTGIINLGTGRSRKVQEVVNALKTHFPDAEIRQEHSDIPYEASQADITMLRTTLNWVPEYKLEDAISEIVAFERARTVQSKPLKVKNSPASILVTSSSRKVPLVRAMQDASRKLGTAITVTAGDIAPTAVTQYVADAFWLMPYTTDEAIDTLLEGCKQRNIRMILPTRDGELKFWAKHQAQFYDHGIGVIISPPETVARCLDKLEFAAFGIERDLPFIPAAESPDDLNTQRFVVKERFGAGSQGIGLDLDLDAARAHSQSLEAPIFQPFVKGREISIDAWMDCQGIPVGVVLRYRDHVVNGESQITTTFRDKRIESIALEILSVLDLRGPVVMQAIVDKDRRLSVIEVNARFGGASTISLRVGLDSLYWSGAETLNGVKRSPVFMRNTGEVRHIRMPYEMVLYDIDL